MLSEFMGFDHSTVIHLKNSYDSLHGIVPELRDRFNEFLLILPQELDLRLGALRLEKANNKSRIEEINSEINKIIADEKESDTEYYFPEQGEEDAEDY